MGLTLPTSGVYATYMASFFGNLTSAERAALWDQFVTINGFSSANPPTPGDINDQLQFLQFAQAVTSRNQTMALSPDEIKKRDIMFETFDILLAMLTTLQNTVAVQGQNLVFYGKWQEQYTKAMTRVPIYVGGASSTPTLVPNSTVITPTTDLKAITFGYNNISMDDIATWWATNQLAGNNSSFTLSNINGTAQITFKSGSSPSITLSGNASSVPVYIPETFASPSDGTNDVRVYTGSSTSPGFTVGLVPITIGAVTFPANKTFLHGSDYLKTGIDTGETSVAGYVENFKQAFSDWWNNNTDTPIINSVDGTPVNLVQQFLFNNQGINGIPGLPTVPWQHSYVAPTVGPTDAQTKLADAEARSRAEINARNQQYIENIRSLRTTVQNTAQNLESGLSQSKEAISQESNILTDIMDSLKGIIAAIFK